MVTTLITKIWESLRRPEPTWDHRCERGTPVPEEDRCSGLACPTLRLSDLRAGAVGTVSCLELPESPRAQRLVGMGILPGAAVQLMQTFPAYVFRVGRAELAVDRQLARHIRVRVEAPEVASTPAG